MIVEQFEEQVEQSANQSLVMAVSLHTFITGQPMRLRPVRKALKHCAQHKQATASGTPVLSTSPTTATLFRWERSLVAKPGMPTSGFRASQGRNKLSALPMSRFES